MNLGTIKNTIRTLNASPLPTRWTDQLLAQLINQGSNQLVIDVNYPEATMTWSTNPPPSAPTVVYTGAAGTTSYVYALAAVATVPLGTATSTGGDSAPGASVTSANAAATLDATHYNTLTFGSLKGTTYKVLRQIAGTDTTWQYIGSTTATGATTTFKDNGLASQAYVVSRGNEYELPQLVKILRVYLADTAGDQQPLVPTDLQTAAGIVAGTWDQTSGTIQGAPQYTPQYLAQQGTAFPVASQFGRPSLTVPWQNVSLGTQRPMYYLRGGFLGVLPPPLTTYTVKMDYVPQPPTLVANGDQSLFPDNFTDALAYKVLEYMAISDDNSRADSFRARYEQECRKLMDRFVSSLQGDKPRSLDPQTIRTDMRQWPT